MAKKNNNQLYVLFYKYKGKQEIKGIFDDEQKAVNCLESHIEWAASEELKYHTARMRSNLSKQNPYTNIAIFSLIEGQEPVLYEEYWISTQYELNPEDHLYLPF